VGDGQAPVALEQAACTKTLSIKIKASLNLCFVFIPASFGIVIENVC
jgi:hypothetical protein